ncbi:MAG TPA: VWA domain-containing protein [Vicinamibacterales bacterium]|nr:VWA domain-containing protein [Vicinamibacterales bacterium]
MSIRHFAAAAAIAALCAGVPAASSAQDPQAPRATFRSALDVVTINASVRDRQGKLVTGLKPEDFEIRDNGQLRRVLSLRADRESPITLAILVDMSGSMRLSGKVAMARQAYDSVLAQLVGGRDEVALFAFDEALHERRGFTRDIKSLADGLDEFEPFGSTSLYDATAATARRLAGRAGSSKAIVVLTDGADTSSRLSAGEVSGIAASIDVPVYVVATVPPSEQFEAAHRAAAREADAADLRDLAAWTGGQFAFASSVGQTVMAAAALVADLRHQYLLGIEAADDPQWRRIDVKVRRPAITVKARAGYFGG